MRISTTLLPRPELSVSDRIEPGDVAVVIDVLRATSVMATALHHGASSIVTTGEVAMARQWAESHSPRPLLCGERACRPIDGFDLGNSPAEYTPQRVRGKTLLLTTTNGTRAIEFAQRAGAMIAASFLNLGAVVRHLRQAESVHFVCAGTNGEVTGEDVLLAGALVDACETQHETEACDDTSWIARQFWRSNCGEAVDVPGCITRQLRDSQGGRNLVRAGYEDDLRRCARLDSIDHVPTRVSTDAGFAQWR